LNTQKDSRKQLKRVFGTPLTKCPHPTPSPSQLRPPPWDPHLKERTTQDPGFNLIDNLTRGLYEEVWRGLPEGKLPGPDEIPNDILKRMPSEFHDLLFEVMIMAWKERRTPLLWKHSVVALLYKKGDPELLKNWRPIALANCIYKLWTALVTRLLVDYAEQHSILQSCQEGFRRGKNTARQLSRMMLAIEDAHLTGNELHVMYIDFENAFGSPDHDRLLWVMGYLGLPQDAIEVVGNLYPGANEDVEPMHIKVRTPYGETGEIGVRRGTIQGDTLSPLLFLFYIEPLLRWLNTGDNGYKHGLSAVRTSAPAFADDLALVTGKVPNMCAQLGKVELFSDWSGMNGSKAYQLSRL
jgi:hypothetical protein